MSDRRRFLTAATFVYLLALHQIRALSFDLPNFHKQQADYGIEDAIRTLEERRNQFGDNRFSKPDDNEDSRLLSPSVRNFLSKLAQREQLSSSEDNYGNRNMAEYFNTDITPDQKLDISNHILPEENQPISDDDTKTDEIDAIFDDDDKTRSNDHKTNTEELPESPQLTRDFVDIPDLDNSEHKFMDISDLSDDDIDQLTVVRNQLKDKRNKKSTEEVTGNELNKVFNEDTDDVVSQNVESSTTNVKTNKNNVKNHNNKKTIHGAINNVRGSSENPSPYSRLFRYKRYLMKRSPPHTQLDSNVISNLKNFFDLVAKLRLKERIENREIKLLSQSLNKATNSQINPSIDGLQGELSSLEQAIILEKLLQKIDKEMTDADRQYLDLLSEAYIDDQEQSPEKNKKSKRLSIPSIDDEEIYANDERLGSPDKLQSDIDESLTEASVEKAMGDILDNDRDRQAAIESPPDGSEDRETDINNIQELLDRVSEKNPDRDDISNSHKEKSCPELETLTDGCLFTNDMGISIDEEARELCARHETCYACSWTLQKDSKRCDAAYTDDTVRMCGRDGVCLERALTFLDYIRNYHRVGSRLLNACISDCVQEFIFGINNK